MPKRERRTPLGRLAAAHGVELRWLDAWSNLRATAPETSAGILEAMGVPARSAAEVERSVADLARAAWTEPVPPLLVVRAAAPPPRLAVHLPVPARSGAVPKVTLELLEEGGGRHGASFPAADLLPLGRREIEGRAWERFGVPLAGPLPLGYHTLRVTARRGGRRVFARELPLVVCPDRGYQPPELDRDGKAAGLALAIYGLRSSSNLGVGDLGDLRRFTDWAVGALGVAFIGLNPLHAIRNRFPFNTSPYLPLSGQFRNHLYVDVAAVPEFADSAAPALLASEGTAALVAGLRGSPYVNYDDTSALKLRLLRACFERFLEESWNRAGRSARRREFEDFLAREGPALERFALFAALDEEFSARDPGTWSWRQWPEPFRNPDGDGAREFLGRHRERVLFHQYVQWLLDDQLAALDRHARAAGLDLGYYHDLAMAVDEHGADCWAAQELFVPRARVGAPPDDFNAAGQDWGFPPPHPERDRARGHRAFAEQIRRACRHAGLLRIDHAMRLARLFWIPSGMPASAGAYVRYARDELLGIVALESVRNRTVIVGEDLGVVPPGFREAMADSGFCSCRLLYFERREDEGFRAPAEYPLDAMVSITTHDLPTLAGWWSGADLETRRAIGLLADPEEYEAAREARRADRRRLLALLSEHGLVAPGRRDDPGDPGELDGELHNAVVGLLCGAPSRFFLLGYEDLFKVPEQQNVPGTVTERPNWVWRMPFTVDELGDNPAVKDFAAMYRGWIERTGRRVRA